MPDRRTSWRLVLRPGRGRTVPPVSPGGEVSRVVIVAESAAWLRRFLAEPGQDRCATTVRVRRLDVRLRHWAAPQPGWSGRLGPLPGLAAHRFSLPRRRPGAARVELEVAEPVDLRTALTAVLGVLVPGRAVPRTASAEVTAVGGAPSWLPAGPSYAAAAVPPEDGVEIRATDLILAAPGHALRIGERVAAAVLREPPVLIDTSTANPVGRHRFLEPGAPSAALRVDATGGRAWWRLVDDDGSDDVHGGPLDGRPLSTDTLAHARRRATVRVDPLPGVAPYAEASLLAQLAATGAVLHVPRLPACVADQLATPLHEVLAEPWSATDPYPLELRSVRQRRAALRGHGAAAGLSTLGAGTFPALAGPPTVTAIVVTRRPDHLAEVVRQLAAQTYPRLEIVVCLHGAEIDAATRAAVEGCGRPVDVTRVPATLSFGEALGEATGRARGSLITKVDDDDDYGPEHVWDLVLAREYSGAALVGKAAEFVHLRALGVTVRRIASRPEAYGPPVAGGTMLIGRGDLEAVGGWRPVPRSVDLGLIARVVAAGGLVYRTHPMGYVYERRTDGHTWDADLGYFLRRSGQQWTGLPDGPEFLTAGRVDAVRAGG